MTIGMGDIIRIGFRLVSHREQIAQTWAEIEPVIRGASKLSPQIKDLVEKVAPEIITPDKAPGGPETYSVQWLQESLNKLDNAGLVVDGDYGEATKAAVRKFQEKHGGLKVDGWAGIATQAAILEALG